MAEETEQAEEKRGPGRPKGAGKKRGPGRPKGAGKRGSRGRPKGAGKRGPKAGRAGGFIAKAVARQVKLALKSEKAGTKDLVRSLVAKELKKALRGLLG